MTLIPAIDSLVKHTDGRTGVVKRIRGKQLRREARGGSGTFVAVKWDKRGGSTMVDPGDLVIVKAGV